jgi:two-component system LytT family response regulator
MTPPIKVLIVEDDPVQQLLLMDWLGLITGTELLGCADSAKEGLRILRDGNVDILLLDIYLPDVTGMNLIKSLPAPPKIILQSSSMDHAIEGFDIGVVDYLVKPYTFERFSKAIQRAMELISGKSVTDPPEHLEKPGDHIFIKSGYDLHKVRVRDIRYIEAMQNYSRLHLVGDEELVTLVSLRRLHEQLGEAYFFRSQKSFLVNLRHIEGLGKDHVKIGGKNLPLGTAYREALEIAWINARVITR